MFDISNSYNRIYTASEYFHSHIGSYSRATKDHYIVSSAYVNYLWQSWNTFWRSFWLTYLLGGKDLSRGIVNHHPVLAGHDTSQAIYYLLYLFGKWNRPSGSIRGSYQEPTWGDITTIRKIASLSHPAGSDISVVSNRVIGALNVLGDTPKHFQKVRNCAIHLTSDTIADVTNNVQPHYAIRRFNYPTELLFSKDLSTGKIAYQHWIDELLAVIKVIYI
ncbi:hypothetical protein KJ762_08210 [bacterium]|nr:hypothetical protein [bacterium]MBU1063466.1 hypothetical protein [bacterium]MBU1634476.1 hypothetical protein [bacterium]MBU1874646.1 hypothetical protein [bacterium]